MLGPLYNQTVNMETDAKTLFYTLLKKEITHSGYSTPKNLQIDGSFFVSHRTHTVIPLLFCIFGDLYASGTQDAEITKSLHVQQMYMIFCNSSSPDSNEICLRLTSVRQKTILNIVWEVFCIRTGEGHKVLASIGRSLTSFLALLKIDR